MSGITGKFTAIIGATPNTARYAFIAAEMLTEYGNSIVPLGIKKGEVLGNPIQDIRTSPQIADIHTVTLYVGPAKQPDYYDYLLSLKPERLIFNPGTENQEFFDLAQARGIEAINACTVVMLRLGMF